MKDKGHVRPPFKAADGGEAWTAQITTPTTDPNLVLRDDKSTNERPTSYHTDIFLPIMVCRLISSRDFLYPD